MTTVEETLKHDLIARLTAPTPKTEHVHCMVCGRGLNAERAKLGGRQRFCSDRCMAAFDAGWPIYDHNQSRVVMQVPLAKWVVVAGPPGTVGTRPYVITVKPKPKKMNKKAQKVSGGP